MLDECSIRTEEQHTYLDEVGLVLLIPRRYKSVHFSSKADLFFAFVISSLAAIDEPPADLLIVVVRHIPLRETCLPLPILCALFQLQDITGFRYKLT